MRSLPRLMTLTLIVCAAACGGAASTDTTPAGGPEPAPKAKDVAPTPAKEPVLVPYVAIQELLADDKITDLATLAARVVTASEALQDQRGIAEVIVGAGRVPSPDIETARVGFEKMSMGLISYLKAHPAEQEGYEVCFCPMAFNNKGAYWVQKKGEILNPYHGKMMLRCGDHVEWEKAPG